MRSVRAFAINVSFGLGVIIITLLLLEVILRVSGIQKVVSYNPPIYQEHENSEIAYSLIPSHQARAYGATVTTNTLGFRSPDVPDGVRPIVILGDSVVFGFGVHDHQTIGSYLQEMLPEDHILSAGVNGYNLRQERSVYESTLASLNPKRLALFFMPNDYLEDYVLDDEGFLRHRSDTDARPYAERVAASVKGGIPIPFKGFMQRNSAFFTFVERTTKNLPFRSHADRPDINEDPVTEEQMSAYKKEFMRFSRIVQDLPRLFVIWPENNLHIESRAFLKELAEGQGWDVIDLYDIYGNSYESLGWDGHPSPKTNRRTAEILFEAIGALK